MWFVLRRKTAICLNRTGCWHDVWEYWSGEHGVNELQSTQASDVWVTPKNKAFNTFVLSLKWGIHLWMHVNLQYLSYFMVHFYVPFYTCTRLIPWFTLICYSRLGLRWFYSWGPVLQVIPSCLYQCLLSASIYCRNETNTEMTQRTWWGVWVPDMSGLLTWSVVYVEDAMKQSWC